MVSRQKHLLSSYARLGTRALASRLTRLPAPVKLTAAVTGRCNARCTYCSCWRGEGVGAFTDELSTDEWDRLLASCGEHLVWLDLTGGEPFMRHDLAEICHSAVARCPNLLMLHFPTNGLDPELIERESRRIAAFDEHPFRLVVSISINGPPEMNDKLRRVGNPPDRSDRVAAAAGPGAFDLACETLRRLLDAGVEAYAGLTLSKLNEDLLEQTTAAIAQRVPGFHSSDLHVNLFHDSAAFYGSTGDLSPAPQSIQRVLELKRADSLFALAEMSYLALCHDFLRNRSDTSLRGGQLSPVRCGALRSSAYIAPDGTLFPCQPWGREVGSLREHGLDLPRLWRSAAAEDALEDYRRHECPGCWTPCEAYQALAARPEAMARALARVATTSKR